MFIKLLDKNLANMIAAGEVVERPASAVKELCENSIDAGASIITVEIRSGGIKQIKVTDNGCGIHPEDVGNAFLRHATSKISKPEDLNSIYTLGFRGEALASIAAVAKVSLYTRTLEFETGMVCNANYGEIEDAEERPGFVGTSITVNDLFYNVPARMKFLKKDSTEAGYVEEVVRKMAIAHPEISFRFINDGTEKLFTPGDANLMNTLFTIYGKEVVSQLRPLEYTDGLISVSGVISNPVYTKKTRNMQTYYVNNRPIVSRMMMSAVAEATTGFIPQGAHPVLVLKLDIPADKIDINVHPAKLEVKFSEESKIYGAVYHAIKNAYQATAVMPQIKEPEKPDVVQAVPEMPEKTSEVDYISKMKEFQAINGDHVMVVKSKEETSEPDETEVSFVSAPRFGQTFENSSQVEFVPEDRGENIPKNFGEYVQLGLEHSSEIEYNIIGQLFKTYILVEKGNDLLLVDQHAAHEHILYAELAEKLEKREFFAQQLLSPQVITLQPSEKACVLENTEFFAEIGFEVQDFGTNDVCVSAVPADMDNEDIGKVVSEIAMGLTENKMDKRTAAAQRALYTVACRAAIKAGKNLGDKEKAVLVSKVLDENKTVTCPHGRPAVIAIEKSFIEKQFKRIK